MRMKGASYDAVLCGPVEQLGNLAAAAVALIHEHMPHRLNRGGSSSGTVDCRQKMQARIGLHTLSLYYGCRL
jgi:hypothetical protein